MRDDLITVTICLHDANMVPILKCSGLAPRSCVGKKVVRHPHPTDNPYAPSYIEVSPNIAPPQHP